MTEAEFQRIVVDLARLLGWADYHTHDSRRSNAGFPDLILIRGERLVVAELKSERGHATPEQRRWLGLFEGAGAEAFLWRPDDLPKIQRVLSRS